MKSYMYYTVVSCTDIVESDDFKNVGGCNLRILSDDGAAVQSKVERNKCHYLRTYGFYLSM